jgi:uncharacterized protein
MIERKLKDIIISKLFSGKAIIILGARQVGKTTLIKDLIKNLNKSHIWANGDEADVRQIFENPSSTKLKSYIGNKEIIVIDEAQRIQNIGLTLKIITESFTGKQIIVTGSSSFDLSNIINEPLTGRKYQYYLYPLSFSEMCDYSSFLEEKRLLENRLIYGLYPEVVTKQGEEKEILSLLSESYLYKDIFNLENIKKHTSFEKLLLSLALQIGNEVSFNELANHIGIDKETVEKYIDLLEKSFVIFKLNSLSRNARNEIKKGKKFYFYDNGIRNSIIKNFNPLKMRNDTGYLWENFLISERMKFNHYNKIYANYYFWRTQNQVEIDFIEEREGKLFAYEFKWNEMKKYKIPNSFKEHYPESEGCIITPDNFNEFIS